jgi:hypothetical protein
MLKRDFWKDAFKFLLGYCIVHTIMTIYSAITGILPHSVIPGFEFTMEVNYLALVTMSIPIPILVHRLFLREGSPKIGLKDILKILNGALFLGVMLGISEKNPLLLGVSLVLVLILGYINFIRD